MKIGGLVFLLVCVLACGRKDPPQCLDEEMHAMPCPSAQTNGPLGHVLGTP